MAVTPFFFLARFRCLNRGGPGCCGLLKKDIHDMQKLRCHSCGKELPKGSLKYVVEIRSFADFDGYLEDYEGDVEEGINELLDSMEASDAKTLEEDVSKELIYILCKSCSDKFTSDPFQTGKAVFEGEDVKGTIH